MNATSSTGTAPPPDRQRIEYIRPDVPDFEQLTYPGRRYEALVPDTLDLQDRAALGINGITGPTDPDADYEIYFIAYFGRNKPIMEHSLDVDCQAKLQESLPLLRLVSGSDLNCHVDPCWMRVMLQMQGPDGLLYHPVKGRPWYCLHGGLDVIHLDPNEKPQGRTPPVGYRPQVRPWPQEIPEAGHVGNACYNGRGLAALALYYQLTGETLWKRTGQRLVEGLGGVTQMPFWPGGPRDNAAPTALADPWIIQGLSQFFRITGHEPALDLARRCVDEMTKSYWTSGGEGTEASFIGGQLADQPLKRAPFGWAGPGVGRKPHFHSTTVGLLSVLEYAMATGDQKLMSLVREGYEYARLLGQTTVGFFPERVTHLWSDSIKDRTDFAYETSETCEVADMIALALKLTEAGQGDYWDDADRWLRNQFAEAQLTDVEWVYRMTEELPRTPCDPTYQTTDSVPERSLGVFAGWPSVNDWYSGAHHTRDYYPDYPGQAIMQCCTGNGTRAIYYAWQRILDHDNGVLRVNLLLNRASPWADVDSYIPYEGRVDIRIKQPCDLLVRIPEWVSPQETACRVNDAARAVQWQGRYAAIGPVQPGDVAAVTFPIGLQTFDINVLGSYYKIVRKGNEVVTIDPAGKYCPFYQRAHYRTNSARWKKATRFVSDKKVDW